MAYTKAGEMALHTTQDGMRDLSPSMRLETDLFKLHITFHDRS